VTRNYGDTNYGDTTIFTKPDGPFAMSQPDEADVNEILFRTTAQAY
jgi:hypothetical protein